jgi:DNA-binding NarL/FixJ family response regulator
MTQFAEPADTSYPSPRQIALGESAGRHDDSGRTTVLTVDDHPVWRRGLRDILEPTFRVIGEAGGAAEAVEKARACVPQVVLMDILMPGMDGIAAAREIKEVLPDTGVVMLTSSSDDAHVHEAIRAGVSGYVVKDEGPKVIIEAVARAAEGHAYLPPAIARRVLQGMRLRDAVSTGGHDLSARESSVLRLIAEGYRQKEIARELCISPRTVGNHVANIYNKLGIADRAQAIVYAIKKGIVRP